MDTSLIPALAGFAIAATITPGPNNVMVMASGVNFGFRRTVPHLVGVTLGATVLIALSGMGVATIFTTYPGLRTVMMFVAAIYLLYLAWKIANSAPPEDGKAEGKPLTLLQAAAFQWVNPKVWATGLSAVTVYAPDTSTSAVLVVAAAFGIAGFSSNSLWTWCGTILRAWLKDRNRLRIFNIAMATLLVFSLYPVLLG